MAADTKSAPERIEHLILGGPPYLEEKKPFVTMADIADTLDVSKETVRRNIDEGTSHPAIDSTTVSQARVFWRSHTAPGIVGDNVEVNLKQQRNKLIGTRAMWLQTSQEFLDGELAPSSPQSRWKMWRVLGSYLDRLDQLGTVTFGNAATEISLPDEYTDLLELEEFEDSDVDPLPAGFRTPEFENRLYDLPLFNAPFGTEVRGVAMLLPHFVWTWTELGDNPDEEALDEILPSAKDIHHAGSVLDHFVAQLHGFYW